MGAERHAAFLRGINLGRRRVAMSSLKGTFEACGLENVATFIASGNVVFDHRGGRLPALETRLEKHISTTLGFDSDTFIRPLAELRRIAGEPHIVSARTDGFTVHVIFLRSAAGAGIAHALRGLEGPDDRFHTDGREVFWMRRGRLSDSPVADRDLAKALGGATTTMRNMNTIERMVAKFS